MHAAVVHEYTRNCISAGIQNIVIKSRRKSVSAQTHPRLDMKGWVLTTHSH